MIEVFVVVSVPGMKGRYSMPQMYLWWSFCPLCLLTFQARVTIDD